MLPNLATLLLALAATTTHATPLKRAVGITASDITKIYPGTSTCANPPAANECRTATQAAPFISISFTNFGISDFPTQAALLSLILYETAGFKYSINHYPGVPRTRNPKYAESRI